MALRANLACLSIPLGQHAVLTLPHKQWAEKESWIVLKMEEAGLPARL